MIPKSLKHSHWLSAKNDVFFCEKMGLDPPRMNEVCLKNRVGSTRCTVTTWMSSGNVRAPNVSGHPGIQDGHPVDG